MNRTWLRFQSKLHAQIYKISNGRFGKNFGAPVLLLTTIGRKSGKERTTPLFYLSLNKGWAVTASNAGSDKHPNWWLNLQAQPQATIQIADRTYDIKAQKATNSEQSELWPRFVEMFPGYDTYQQETDRTVPIIILNKRL